MADIGSVAARRQLALESINKTIPEIAEWLGLDAPTVPKIGRDVTFLQMKQLETMAEFIKQVRDRLAPVVDVSNATEPAISEFPNLTPEERETLFGQIERDYTVAELKQIADENAIEYPANTRKDALINQLIDAGLANWDKNGGESDGHASDE
jgi:hypothetical protein